MKLYLGIDQSKRCTACVAIDDNGGLTSWCLICPPHELDGVDLLDYQLEGLLDFVEDLPTLDVEAVIEGLSFAAVGSGKDMLAALNWMFRWQMNATFGIFLGPVPVTSWRSKVLDKVEQREAKSAGKDGLKVAVVNKLPASVKKDFTAYVEGNKDMILRAKDAKWKEGSKSQKYKEAMFDLADAYYLATYRLGIK